MTDEELYIFSNIYSEKSVQDIDFDSRTDQKYWTYLVSRQSI